MTASDDFNQAQIASGALRISHVTELVRSWQRDHPSLAVDGMAGAQTIQSIARSIQSGFSTPATATALASPEPGARSTAASPDDFNRAQLSSGLLRIPHVTEMVGLWQRSHPPLAVDGMAGARTIESIAAAVQLDARPSPAPVPVPDPAPVPDPTAAVVQVEIDQDGWPVGPRVTRIVTHPSWLGGDLVGGEPGGIVAHFTDTDPGTAIAMANRRSRPFAADPQNRMASWHATVEADGAIIAMVPLTRVAWHAGSSTARPVPGLGEANYHTNGIELIGYGKEFTPPQVTSATWLWRAIVRRYRIDRRYAMVSHQSIDPERRDDPGPLWMGTYAPIVVAAAYA